MVSFLKFHLVFTSAMTGNIALLGLSLGKGELSSATHSITALIGFLLGAYTGSILMERRVLVSLILAAEAGILLIYAGLWLSVGINCGGVVLYILIVLSSLSMGLQSIAARLINIAGIPSVVFTNTITSIIIQVYECIRKKTAISTTLMHQLAALFSYLAGAIVFSWLLYNVPAAAAVLPVMIIGMAAAFRFVGRYAI